MTTKFPFIITVDGLTITVDGIPHFISDDRYDSIIAMIGADVDSDEDIRKAVSVKEQLQKLAAGTGFEIRGNQVYFDGERVPTAFEARVLQYVKDQLPLTSFAAYFRLARKNPSKLVFDRMWEFIEFGKMPLTSDGHFLAYKRVKTGKNGQLVDCYTGDHVNEPGTTLIMERRLVDDNMNNTCSHGYHVCSHAYLAHFSGTHTVTCKVSPEDVVAIPPDYNNTKMRVCKYEVIEILPDYVRETPVLSNSIVMDSYTAVQTAPTESGSIVIETTSAADVEFKLTASLDGVSAQEGNRIAAAILCEIDKDVEDFDPGYALDNILDSLNFGPSNAQRLTQLIHSLAEALEEFRWYEHIGTLFDVSFVQTPTVASQPTPATPAVPQSSRGYSANAVNPAMRWGIVPGNWKNNVWIPAAGAPQTPHIDDAFFTRDQAKRAADQAAYRPKSERYRVYDKNNRKYV